MTSTAGNAGAECPNVTSALRADLNSDGCDDPLDFAAGVLSSPVGRFRVGAAADRAATGRWTCRSSATLALLRPDGTVFVADAWAAPGHDVVLRQVGAVAGAVEITGDDSDGDGCDELVVHKRDGGSTTIRPGGGK
jgi:hypothetical protein